MRARIARLAPLAAAAAIAAACGASPRDPPIAQEDEGGDAAAPSRDGAAPIDPSACAASLAVACASLPCVLDLAGASDASRRCGDGGIARVERRRCGSLVRVSGADPFVAWYDAATGALVAVTADGATGARCLGGPRGFTAPTACDPPTVSACPAACDLAPGPCAPADEAAFEPRWHPPRAPRPACTAEQIAAYRQCLEDRAAQADPPSCARFEADAGPDVTCARCIVTDEASPSYGPLIAHARGVEVNVAGCVALADDDPRGTGCGGTIQAAAQCTQAACAAGCGAASADAEQACESCAAALSCFARVDHALSCGGAYTATCALDGTFDDQYALVVALFCGGASATADGGAD